MPELDKMQMEADFLSASEDKVGIYQLKRDDSLRDYLFEGTEYLNKKGLSVDKENYDLIYVMDLKTDMDLERIFEIFNIDHPEDFRGHSLSVSDMVVLHQDGENSCHFVDRFGFTEIPDFLTSETEKALVSEMETEVAVQIGDKYISIQEATEGYDYTIYHADYKEWDGGIYDDMDISIGEALDIIIEDVKKEFHISAEPVRVDYDELEEKCEKANALPTRFVQNENTGKNIMEEDSDVVAKFKERTEELFHAIDEMHPEEIEALVYVHVQEIIDTYDMDAQIVGIAVSGSRARGLEDVGSDLDVVVEIKGGEREDVLFDAFNEDPIVLNGIKIDINPITEEKTGTLETYLPQVEEYLAQKASEMEQQVTLYVATCSEYHNFGPVFEGFTTVQDAIEKYEEIAPQYASNIPAIGVNIHNPGEESYMDIEWDVLVGKTMDIDTLSYIGDITSNEKAMLLIAELADRKDGVEIWGECPEFQSAMEKYKDQKIIHLATEIDQLAQDIDPYEYANTVDDKSANIESIAADIRSGNTDYIEKFLNATIDNQMHEGLGDIMASGTNDIATIEAVQNMRKAQQLVEQLAEYKPLAKVEMLEEQNYNMIDNVLNNGFGEKERKATEDKKERISIREKLKEKKEEIAKKQEILPQEQEKKPAHREK